MIKVDKLTKSYDKRVVLDKITCEIGNGLTFVVGDSGEGKSTFLNIIGALDVADKGEVHCLGYSVRDENRNLDDYRAKTVGFVFQETNLINGLTVFQNIELAVAVSGKKAKREEILNLLTRFHMEKFIDVKVEKLSGGEKQRIALVRALAKNAKVILADEPTGSLDEKNSEVVFQALKEIAKDRIVVVITHNIEKAYQYADSILEIQNGTVNVIKQEEQREHLDGCLVEKEGKPFLENKYIYMLSLNNIKKHIGKFVSMVLALAVIFMLVAAVFSMKTSVTTNVDEMNYTYYEADQIDIYPEDLSKIDTITSKVMGGEMGGFTETQINKIEEMDEFVEVVPVASGLVYLEGTYTSIDIKPIKLNEYFYNRIMNDSIEGKFPENKNEIIIGADLAEELFDTNAVGKNWTLHDQYGNQFEVKIVGINHQKTVDGIYHNYISYEFLLEKERQPYCANSLIFLEEHLTDNGQVTLTEDASGFCLTELSGGNVIYGNAATKDKELTISIEIFNSLYSAITGEIVSYSISDFENINSELKEKCQLVFDKKYYIGVNDTYKVKIVGIHNGDASEILVSKKWGKQISKVLSNCLQCYVKNLNVIEEFEDERTINGFSFYSYYSERFELAVNNNRIWNSLFVIVLVFSILISFLSINSFIKVSVTEKMYEIGILKSLGATKKDIYKVAMSDNLILGICSGVFAASLYVAFCVSLPVVTALKINNVSMMSFIIVVLIISPCLLSLLLCAVKTRRVVNIKPVDAIRRK